MDIPEMVEYTQQIERLMADVEPGPSNFPPSKFCGPGYVLLTRCNSIVNVLVRQWCKRVIGVRGQFGHAALIIDQERVIDARGRGVKVRSLERTIGKGLVCVIQPTIDTSLDFRFDSIAGKRLRELIGVVNGKGYDFTALASLGTRETFGRFYCSELVLMLWRMIYGGTWWLGTEIFTPDHCLRYGKPVWVNTPQGLVHTKRALYRMNR